MIVLGIGLGFVMPVMNIAVQNEFSQKDLGVATSSIQLFRGLGSTVGVALFGALLTSGLATQLSGTAKSSPYIADLAKQPTITQRFGDITDTDTLVTLNMPDVREKIRTSTLSAIDDSVISQSSKQQVKQSFIAKQEAYSETVTDAFVSSLRTIFIASAVIMAPAILLVLATREKELAASDAHVTPGEL